MEFGAVGLAQFLEELALVSDQDTLTEEANAPTLLTVHAAKGLEFPAVFIIGLNEGVFPHQRSMDDAEEMAEERRLMYVGITRAKDRLYLVHTFRRSLWGSSDVGEPSRFLGDIPADLMEGRLVSQQQSPAAARYRRVTSWETPAAMAALRPAESEYRSGVRVNHRSWGEGIVIESRLVGGEEEVLVAFESVGVKRLAASLAKLELLE
ncbi:MAG: ATP-binding domain-containing protein [Chloroflexi bacterium]|nr:ATP-binding domain-containing protein [Chloroflexota bacterium]